MRKIILSLLLIAGAASAITVGSTGAFFSDSEASTGNSFVAGAIDLKIDNESYYNLNKCAEVSPGVFQWQGSAVFPIAGTPCTTSWALADLDSGKLFFNFTDIKPDDEGEDTISMHAQNDAFVCLDMTLTSNDDSSSTEPELLAPDTQEDINNTWDGELAQNLKMFWWADDGDNVYEVGEIPLMNGVMSVSDMFGEDRLFSATLADINTNVWTGGAGPIPAETTKYIAKAWCFGNMLAPGIAQDGQGHLGTNGPQARGTGIVCDGTALNNLTQTDGLTLDVAFRAIQARHNTAFVCGGEQTRTAKLTVIKQIINDNGGNNGVPDFQLFVDNGITEIGVTSNVQTTVLEGTYTITETGVSGYVASFSGDCDANGEVTLAAGDVKTCTITNNDLPANITLIKNVINNNGGSATSNSAWGLKIDGNTVPNNTSVAVNANTPHLINETGRPGYHFVSITGAGCPASTSTPIILNEGQSITCTITNDDN
jgi:predicted ribosomally synthesized peptide with SipW-like signal peptide